MSKMLSFAAQVQPSILFSLFYARDSLTVLLRSRARHTPVTHLSRRDGDDEGVN